MYSTNQLHPLSRCYFPGKSVYGSIWSSLSSDPIWRTALRPPIPSLGASSGQTFPVKHSEITKQALPRNPIEWPGFHDLHPAGTFTNVTVIFLTSRLFYSLPAQHVTQSQVWLDWWLRMHWQLDLGNRPCREVYQAMRWFTRRVCLAPWQLSSKSCTPPCRYSDYHLRPFDRTDEQLLYLLPGSS